MNKGAKLVIALAVIVIIAVGGILIAKRHDNKTNSPNNNNQTSNNTTTADATITYDGTQFKPNPVTIKAGQTVKIINSSSNQALAFESDPHPTHTDEPELNAGQVDPGSSTIITVTKTGHWGYHNHLDPSQKGSIVVN